MPDESRILRDRIAGIGDAFDASLGGGASFGSAAMLCQTTSVSSYPTSAAGAYACNPVSASGAESEGTAAVYTTDTSTVIYVLNLGSSVIPQGTRIVAESVGGRWVTYYNG